MIINVTQEDIKAGQPVNCYWCPIAQAIKRLTGAKHVYVEHAHVNVNDDPPKKLPRKASAFIRKFDSRKPVEPFDFELDI